jgi:hypothetical protein
MRKLLSFTRLAVTVTAAVGCGGVSGPPEPQLIPGGGIASGKIDKYLNVYVTDEETRNAISSASVRVGASSDPSACVLLTDSTGLAKFEPMGCPSLKGPVTVTVSATSSYSPVTWIGVNGANLTIPMRNGMPPALDTATVSGTIAGWASLPVPAANHQTLALVGASQTNTLGDRANDIPQGMRNVVVNGTAYPIPSNLCVVNASVSDCNWTLTTRTGQQALIAIIVDQYNNLTPNDDTDDVFTLTSLAIKTGLSLAKGDNALGESLDIIPDTNMQTLTASFPSLPSGMNFMGGFPMLELGDDGRIALTIPALDMTHTTVRVPKLTGALANAHYSLIAQAQDAKDQKLPASLAWMHNVNIGSTVALSSWLAPPSNVATTGGTYSFSAVPGATVHQGEIQGANGNRVWSITTFDGSTSFTLPGLSPDPLPTGTLTFQAGALLIPGIDLGNLKLDDAKDKITGIGQDAVTFTR